MNLLNKKSIKAIIKGASILTTGGGLSPLEQLKSIDFKLVNNNLIQLKNIKNLDEKEIIITVGELGPANAPEINKRKIIKSMLDIFENMLDKKISGIYFPELGQETCVIESANLLNLPVIDFDPVGGRAVPCVDISCFNLLNINYSLSPLVVSTYNGEIMTINTPMDYNRIEDVLRNMTNISKHNILYFIGGAVQIKNLKPYFDKINNKSISTALSLGESDNIMENRYIKQNIIKDFGEVSINNVIEYDKAGFNFKKAIFETKDNQEYSIIVMNEVLFLLDKDNNVINSVPERILLLNSKENIGVHNKYIKAGKKLNILVLKPEQIWDTDKGRKLFGKERFIDLLKNNKTK